MYGLKQKANLEQIDNYPHCLQHAQGLAPTHATWRKWGTSIWWKAMKGGCALTQSGVPLETMVLWMTSAQSLIGSLIWDLSTLENNCKWYPGWFASADCMFPVYARSPFGTGIGLSEPELTWFLVLSYPIQTFPFWEGWVPCTPACLTGQGIAAAVANRLLRIGSCSGMMLWRGKEMRKVDKGHI